MAPHESSGRTALSRGRAAVILGILVLLAIGLRGYRLGAPALWVDEAESALNALTIVADGLPGDSYLGQPLYENTLMQPWPGHPEYEFRDLSYSDRGLAVYHAWIPLYAIAAAFRVAGVSSAEARVGPPVQHASLADLQYWTAVPRVPSLLFSAVLVVTAWALGRAVHGQGVAVALALAAATSNFFVYAGRQARYYSAALAFDALCGLAIWHAWRRGRLRDHALAGLSIAVLFHVHPVSAVAMTAVYVACIPLGFTQPRLWLRLMTAGITAAVLIVPWAIWSGLLSQAVRQPPARDYLDVAMVLWSLPTTDPAAIATFLVGAGWLIAAYAGFGMPASWRRPILDQIPALYFAACWLLLSYAVFVAVMPAASYFPFRLRLFVAVPGLLVIALVVAAACRAVRPTWPFLPVAALATLLVFSGQLPRSLTGEFDLRFADLVRQMQDWTLRDGRVYASPNDHLVFTYYTGRPVQNVAAVRREWLDAYSGDLVIVEGVQYQQPDVGDAQEVARRVGVELSPEEATTAVQDAVIRATTLHLQASGLQPTAPPLPPRAIDQPLLELTRDFTRRSAAQRTRGTPLGRQSFTTWDDYRTAFFFWFAGPEQRIGPHLNYAACRKRARVTVHPSGHTVMDCRTQPGRPLLAPSDQREDVS